jgi:N-acyl-phosphatidylethanolamine-hydrolysing phospholipase D
LSHFVALAGLIRVRFIECQNLFTVSIVIFFLTGCQFMNPYYDHNKDHHTKEGFKNNYIEAVNKPLTDLLRWATERQFREKPTQVMPTPVKTPDLAFIHANAKAGKAMQPAVTWIGHATALVQANGLNILTDPVFSQRASPVQFAGPQRLQPVGLALADLPPIDVILISHNHYDHLDKSSVIALNRQFNGKARFLVPLGIKPWMAAIGIRNVEELDWWQSVKWGDDIEFMFTPVQHWSARGISDRNQTLWGGWAVFGPDFHGYFSGDSGYSRDFIETKKRLAARQTPDLGGGFDLAMIALGAYEPRWFMQDQHINPMEAVQIHRDLGAKRSMGLHWGTFDLTDEPQDQPPKDLALARVAQGIAEEAFFVLAIGETRTIPRRGLP